MTQTAAAAKPAAAPLPEGMVETVHAASCNACGSTRQKPVAECIDFEYHTCTNAFTYVACEDCGLTYIQNRPAIHELDVIYPKDYIPYRFQEHLGGFIATLRGEVQQMKVKPILRLVPAGGTIVDVGPGNGELLNILKTHGRPDWRLVGVDFSAHAVENVKRLGMEGIQSRFEDLEWQGEPPFCIILNQVIEHLEDPAAAVRKAYELLAPGGYLVIETPSLDGWDAKLFAKRYWGGWHAPRHWILFNENTLSGLFRKSGFTVVETAYILSPNFWLQSVHHYLSERPQAWLRKLAPWFDVKRFIPLAAASALDVLQKLVAGHTSNFRMVGQKPKP